MTDRPQTPTDSPLEKRSEGLAAFREVSRSFTPAIDLDRVLQTAVEGVTMLIGFDSAAVYLLDGGQLRLRATVPPLPTDFPDEMRNAPLADHPNIEQAIRTGRPVHVADCGQADLTAAERAIVESRNLGTLLYVPLVSDEHRLGTFIVGSVGEPVPLSEDAIDLSLSLGNLATLAVAHTRLFNESRQYTLRLEQALIEQKRAEEERKGLLEQLAQAQKMETIGRLAGGVAHDFNNLLGVIMGHTELALMQTDPDDDLHRDLLEILRATRRSADIAQQLLAFARKQTIRPRPIDLNEKVAGTLGMLQRLIGGEIDLKCVQGDNLAPVFLDTSQLDQILVNLCANARDAITGVGRITIETASVRLDEDDCADRPDFTPGDYVTLTVSDNGCGMDEETLGNVFEPFFTTKGGGVGTGLGLATVYGIARQNRALIDLKSEPGVGATFRLYLAPHEGNIEAGESRDSTEVETARGETVLVVEDEGSIRRLVTMLLKALNYTVLSADSPTRALELAEDHQGKLDLLLTDVVMPEMNGRELASQLQNRHPGLAVLFMSGYTTDVVTGRGVLADGVHFIQKPFAQRELAEKVRRALEGKTD